MTAIPLDPKMPGWARACDASAMLEVVRAAWGGLEAEGDEPFYLQCRVLKHVPGKRGVIAYDLYSRANLPCGRLIGKLYRKDRGRLIFENLQRLWRAARAAPNGAAGFAMPKPLAYCPELGMVLQQAARGRPLTSLSESEELFAAMPLVARNLAALHRLKLPELALKSFDDHLHKYCHPGPQVLVEALPALRPLVDDCVRLMRAGCGPASAAACPVHGDLNLAQVFIAADRAYFIDFDGMCLSPAALDAGNFLVTLKVHFGARGEELRHIFLENYLAHAPDQPGLEAAPHGFAPRTALLAGLRAYQAFAYFRRAMICFRQRLAADWPLQVERGLYASLALLQG